MKNTSKKILASLLTSTFLIGATAYANAKNDIMLISENQPKIYIDDNLVENATIQNIGGKNFFPLRAICEALGLTVEWINETRTIEIVNLPIYITCSPDRDGYTFARTAPILLGTAPVLLDDTTYVPSNFIDEILGHTYSYDNLDAYINTNSSQQAETVEVSATIVDLIYEDKKLIQIVTGDKEDPMNQLIFNVSDEIAQNEKSLGLEIGKSFTGVAAGMQTMSIPAQQPLLEITAVNEQIETVEVSATIVDLIYKDEKLFQIVTGDKEDPMNQLIFNVSDEIAQNEKSLGLEIGKSFKGIAASIQTMSIPAQQPLFEITEVK